MAVGPRWSGGLKGRVGGTGEKPPIIGRIGAFFRKPEPVKAETGLKI